MNSHHLRQFSDLSADDFEDHPVWIGCHATDYDEPWYDDTDEETFRPFTGPLPVDPADAVYLVRAEFAFRDGSGHTGFVTPAEDQGDLGTMQPQIFLAGARHGFWGGMIGIPAKERKDFYRRAGRKADEIFPLRFEAEDGLAQGYHSGRVEGFYLMGDGDDLEVEF